MSAITIRVYGICINEMQQLLVSDELIYGKFVTKFPGGGLQAGEGTIDCLKREMIEETGQEVDVLEHFYTTDFFVPSAFDPTRQVISIYYMIRFKEAVRFRISDKLFDFEEMKNDAQSFRWIDRTALKKEHLTLEIDRVVGEMILQK